VCFARENSHLFFKKVKDSSGPKPQSRTKNRHAQRQLIDPNSFIGRSDPALLLCFAGDAAVGKFFGPIFAIFPTFDPGRQPPGHLPIENSLGEIMGRILEDDFSFGQSHHPERHRTLSCPDPRSKLPSTVGQPLDPHKFRSVRLNPSMPSPACFPQASSITIGLAVICHFLGRSHLRPQNQHEKSHARSLLES